MKSNKPKEVKLMAKVTFEFDEIDRALSDVYDLLG